MLLFKYIYQFLHDLDADGRWHRETC